MKKRLIMILALAFVVGITAGAYAEVQNIKVGGDITVKGVGRQNFGMTDANKRIGALLGFTRVRLDADLTDNVSATVRLLNERIWGQEADSASRIDLDLAYATMKEFLYAPLTMTVGRQNLRYGNALVIGNPNISAVSPIYVANISSFHDMSMRKSFDAIKAVLDYDPLIVDLVYAKIEENAAAVSDDVNLAGINAAFTVNKDLMTELYLWSRDREWGSTGLATAPGQGERLNVLGARGTFTGIENLVLGLEGAWQFGDHVTDTTVLYLDDARVAGTKSKARAWAMQFVSALGLPEVKYTPVLNFTYTRLSGDKDQSRKNKYTGWDPMFEDQCDGMIANRVLGYSNAQIFGLGGTMKPMEDVTVKLDWTHIRLLQTMNIAADATRTLSGIVGDPAMTVRGSKRHLADEIDLGITYDYTEDVQLGLTSGIYIPGSVYDKRNDKNATQVIGSMKVTF